MEASGRQRPLLHPRLGRGEEERFGIDAVGLAIDRLHAAANEIDQPLRLLSLCAAGIKNNRLIALHRLDQGLRVMQLARVEHQQLRPVGLGRAVYGRCSAKKGQQS